MGHADPDTEIEFPLGAEIHIDGRHDLLLLVPQGVEPRHRSEGAVVLQAAADLFEKGVTELEVR